MEKNQKNNLEDKSSKKPKEGKTEHKSSGKKLSEYGLQLKEKQQVKRMYGVMEKQFKRFFLNAAKAEGAAGENLLSMLERRLDNVIYRLKFATSRVQARQLVVHGHILVNGKKVTSPSFLISTNDVISLSPKSLEQENFVKQVVDKRLNIGIKVPDWLELDKKDYKGNVLRLPIRSDIQTPIEEHLIVELYSK